MDHQEAQIVLRDLVVRRGDPEKGFTLRVPELEVRSGEFLAIVGKSGSGKSTLMDVLALIAEPHDIGRFRMNLPDRAPADLVGLWKGKDDAALSDIRRTAMGYVLQNGALCSFLSAQENIALPAQMRGLSGHGSEALAALDSIGLKHLAQRDVRTLSGGERQRVAILRALSGRPAFVFADEPTGALDFESASRVITLFAERARAQGSGIVMVTHDPELVQGVASRMIRFRQSEAKSEGIEFIAEASPT